MRNLALATIIGAFCLPVLSGSGLAGMVNGGFESHYTGKIIAVDAEKASLTVKYEESDKAEDVQLAPSTVVIINKKERKVADLKAGMSVTITTFTRMEPVREPRVVKEVNARSVRAPKKNPNRS